PTWTTYVAASQFARIASPTYAVASGRKSLTRRIVPDRAGLPSAHGHGVRRPRPCGQRPLRRPRDVPEPGRPAGRADERRADGRLPDHGPAGPLHGADRVPPGALLPRVEV